MVLLSACGWVDDTGIQDNEAPDIQLDATNVANEGDTLRWPLESLDPDGNVQRVSLTLESEGQDSGVCSAYFTPLEAAESLRAACQPNLSDAQCAVSVDIGSEDVLLSLPALRYPVALRYELSVLDTGLQSTSRSVDICVQTVSSPPVGEPDSYSLTYGETLQTTAAQWGEACEVLGGTGVLVNDSDDFDHSEVTANGPPCLVAELVDQPAFASAFTLSADGSFRYVGDGSVGPGGQDSFRYRVNDGLNRSEPVDVRLAITGSNSPPVANSLRRDMDEDGVLTIPVSELGSDPENLPLSLSAVAAPGAGNAEIRDGALYYRPPADYSGPATATFTVVDQGGAQASGQVAITVRPVNDAPEFESIPGQVSISVASAAQPGSTVVELRVRDDETTQSSLLSVSADIDADFAQVDVSSTDTQGRVRLTITPRANGTQDMRVTVRDQGFSGLAATSTTRVVPVTIAGVNNQPDAVDDQADVSKNKSFTVPVLANDSDPDGHAITLVGIVNGPANGSVAVVADGVRYTPRNGFSGTDAFSYRIRDSLGGEATATVDLRVINLAPEARDDTFQVQAGIPRTLTVLENDSDPDGDPVRIARIVSQPVGGQVVLRDNTIVVTIRPDFESATQFQYAIDDFDGGEATATVFLDVEEIQRPSQ